MTKPLLLLLFALPLAAQTAPPVAGADISAYYRLTPSDNPLYQWLHIDAPLLVKLDAAGKPHLTLTPSANTPGGSTTVINFILYKWEPALATPAKPFPNYVVKDPSAGKIWFVIVDGLMKVEGVDYDIGGDKVVVPRADWSALHVRIDYFGKPQ